MNQSSSLFYLIQSLDAGEKRAITVAVKSHRYAKAYLKMFKEMQQQKVYDENKIKQRLKNEPFIGHFAVIKNQLYQFILKVLRGFHESSSLEFILKELMLDASVLSTKALHTESWQKLQRAKELALKFEDWKVLLEILYKEFVHASAAKARFPVSKEYLRIAKELQLYMKYLNNYELIAYNLVTIHALIKEYQNKKSYVRLEKN